MIARRFEKAEAGYVYRRRSDLPGFLVSEDDRQAVLKAFRQRYWRSTLLLWTGFIACVTLIALLAVTFDFEENFLTFSAYGLSGGLVAFVVWEQRQWTLLPERTFADRPRLEPEVPAAGWFDRFRRLSLERSWPKYVVFIAIYGSITWFLLPRKMETHAFHWLIFACFAGSLIFLFYAALHKALYASARREY